MYFFTVKKYNLQYNLCSNPYPLIWRGRLSGFVATKVQLAKPFLSAQKHNLLSKFPKEAVSVAVAATSPVLWALDYL